MRRIGIYGGSFSPPHMGHVRAANAFFDAMELDLLLIIPSHLPPHKQLPGGATTAQRLRMAQLAFGGMAQTVISDMEILRGGKSYTSDTLTSLSGEDRTLFLLVGTDMFLTLGTWHDPATIFRLAEICYVRRENDAALTDAIRETASRYERDFGARIHEIPLEPLPLSSTEVREGRTDADALPAAVRTYITERGLYGYGHRTDRA